MDNFEGLKPRFQHLYPNNPNTAPAVRLLHSHRIYFISIAIMCNRAKISTFHRPIDLPPYKQLFNNRTSDGKRGELNFIAGFKFGNLEEPEPS